VVVGVILTPAARPMTVAEVAATLGVSARMVYGIAAPAGPLPCYRVGRTVRFDPADVEEYKQRYRSTEIQQRVAGAMSSIAVSVGDEPELLKFFRRAGVRPRLTHSTEPNPPGSTPRQPGSKLRASRSTPQLPRT